MFIDAPPGVYAVGGDAPPGVSRPDGFLWALLPFFQPTDVLGDLIVERGTVLPVVHARCSNIPFLPDGGSPTV